jgi:DNA replication protein DnaC
MSQHNNEKLNVATGFNRIFRPYNFKDAQSDWALIARQLEPNLEETKAYAELSENLIRYTLADTLGKFDVESALCLLGTQGVGKTLAFRTLQTFNTLFRNRFYLNGMETNFNFTIYSALEMVSDYNRGGFNALEKYINRSVICIDDLGTEPLESVYFGTKVNVLEKVIELRYMKNKVTHISTNLPPKILKQAYGERVFSRLKGRSYFYFVENEDFRLKQSAKRQKTNAKELV